MGIEKGGRGSHGRVWVVEDSRLEAERISRLLEAEYQIESFVEGAAMLERCGNAALPDLVLLDWQMPGVSGLEACRFLRERYDQVRLPILMLTSRGSRQDFTEGLSAGANDYVAKPYDDAELLGRVRTLVRTRQLAETLRTREEWFETTLRSIADAVITTNVEGRVTFVNPVAEVLTGWSSADALGRRFDEVFQMFDERTGQRVEQLIGASVPLTRRSDVGTHMLRTRNGGEVAIDEHASPIGEGALLGTVVVFRDVRERKRAEREAQERAEFEEKLIGIVSHDLRNPLNVIILSTNLLLTRGDLDARAVRSITQIEASANRATRLVGDLLDFTQARLGGGMPVVPLVADVHQIGAQVVEEMQATFPGHPFRHQAEGPGAGQWDPDRIAQLLTNLISNAVKYGLAECEVVLKTTGGELEVTLEVHNRGKPIPSELLPVMFKPMQRGVLNRSDRSVGLGLFIVKDIVDAHGGTIKVTSTDAEGTTFGIHLPRIVSVRPREVLTGG